MEVFGCRVSREDQRLTDFLGRNVLLSFMGQEGRMIEF